MKKILSIQECKVVAVVLKDEFETLSIHHLTESDSRDITNALVTQNIEECSNEYYFDSIKINR